LGAFGARGATMIAGTEPVKIRRNLAEIVDFASSSARADVDWLPPLENQARNTVFVTHGDPAAASAEADSGMRAS